MAVVFHLADIANYHLTLCCHKRITTLGPGDYATFVRERVTCGKGKLDCLGLRK